MVVLLELWCRAVHVLVCVAGGDLTLVVVSPMACIYWCGVPRSVRARKLSFLCLSGVSAFFVLACLVALRVALFWPLLFVVGKSPRVRHASYTLLRPLQLLVAFALLGDSVLGWGSVWGLGGSVRALSL